MTEQRIQKLKRKLQEARYTLVHEQTEFAMPLYDMTFTAVRDIYRISTNGTCIFFDPDWLQKLGKTELCFILAHQLMHIALGHTDRPQYFKGDRFHLAADIAANARLALMGWRYSRLQNIGIIYSETFYPKRFGAELTSQEAMEFVPFDPAAVPPGQQKRYMIDSESRWDDKADRGESGTVVLSPADTDPEDLAYDGKLYGEICSFQKEQFRLEAAAEKSGVKEPEKIAGNQQDSSSQENNNESSNSESISLRLQNMRKKRKTEGSCSHTYFTERTWQSSGRKGTDWRQLLQSFVQEELFDYSFTPPDKRFQDSGFFLPDFNKESEKPKEVLFMVDTSGSVDDGMLSAAYSELCRALELYGGGLRGLLGFFDTSVYRPVAVDSAEDIAGVVARGGGGTDFQCVFDYVKNYMKADPPASIVIFTDGKAEFPDASAAGNIPVLWLFTAEASAPFGKYARIRI